MNLQGNYGLPSSQVIPFTSAKLVIRFTFCVRLYHAIIMNGYCHDYPCCVRCWPCFFSIARHRRLGTSMGMVFYESMTVSRWLLIFWVSLKLHITPRCHSHTLLNLHMSDPYLLLLQLDFEAYSHTPGGTYTRTESKAKVQWMLK